MNNSNTYKPGTHEIRNLSEHEEDFNYSTYPTVRVDAHKDKLVAKRSNQEAYLSSAVGGSVSQISFKDNARNPTCSIKGGGIRGKIRDSPG